MTRNHSSQYGGAPVLDDQAMHGLEVLAGEDYPALIDELIELFLTDASDRIAGMAVATESGDLERVAQAAHALKSASANLGALPFAEKCKEIERSAREGDHVDDLVAACRAMFGEVQEAMRRYRPRQV